VRTTKRFPSPGWASAKQRHNRHIVTERPEKNDAMTQMTNRCSNVTIAVSFPSPGQP